MNKFLFLIFSFTESSPSLFTRIAQRPAIVQNFSFLSFSTAIKPGASPQKLEAAILKHLSVSNFTGVGFTCGGSSSGSSRLLQPQPRHTPAAAASSTAVSPPIVDAELQLATLLAVTGLTSKEGGAKSLSIVRKILTNIIEHPSTDKYRTLKLSNKAIKKYISDFSEASQILRLVGFIEEDDDDGGRRLRLPITAPLPQLQQIVSDVAKLAPETSTPATKKARPVSKNKAYQQRMDEVNQERLRRQQERQRLLEKIKVPYTHARAPSLQFPSQQFTTGNKDFLWSIFDW